MGGTVNLLNIFDDLTMHPQRIVDFFGPAMYLWRRNFLQALVTDGDEFTPKIIEEHLSPTISSYIFDQHLQLIHTISEFAPRAIIIYVSILPIPKYHDISKFTIQAINNRIRNVLTTKPDRIFIPLTRSFLSKENNSALANQYDSHGIHLVDGLSVLEARLRQWLSSKQCYTKLKSQAK
jgi:hypothetical protein